MSVLDLARAEVRALQAYSSARMEARPAEVMLNANESPWCLDGDSLGLNRYPEPQPEQLCARLGALYGVRPEQLLVGRGSDEAIDLLVRAFCRPGRDAIAICPPTFGMYAVCAAVQGAAVQSLACGADFRLDVTAMLSTLSPAVKLLFVCSPNNPTGDLVPLADIAQLAANLADRALVVVDEAYIEFADSPSAASLLAEYPNLAVLRTLSKAWALAGARIGSLLADAGVIALLRRIMPPYPLPLPSVTAAMAALGGDGEQRMQRRARKLASERERLRCALERLPGVRAVYPSQANFVTVRLDDATAIWHALAAQGIVVRDVGRYPQLANCLRISVGTPEENSRLLDALAQRAEVA